MGMEQNFKLAVKSLMSSKARAILTMLGIIIGVAAVIIITSLGNGMQTMMNEQFEKIGTNLVQVMVMGRGPRLIPHGQSRRIWRSLWSSTRMCFLASPHMSA